MAISPEWRVLDAGARQGLDDETALTIYSAERFARLPPEWHVLALEEDRTPDGAGVYHWVGANKPWRGEARYGERWHAYRREQWAEVGQT